MDELCLRAEAEVTGRPEVGDENLHPPWKPQETPNKRDVSINGGVTMETRREAEEEEESWRKLYPNIKKCVIVVARQRLDRLNGSKLKRDAESGRSGDLEPSADWMEPLELDDRGGDGGFKSFVKKVEVKKVQANRRRRDGADHNYNIITQVPNTSDNSQSQDASLSSSCGHKDGDSCSCSTEKNPPKIVFKKVGGDHWVLRGRPKVKKEKVEEEEEEEDEEDDSSSISSEQMKPRNKENQPVRTKLRRRTGCKQCVACLREDCGKCQYCLDKRKFGGPEKLKQKCRFRVCLLMQETKNRSRPIPLENVEDAAQVITMATKTQRHYWRRQSDEKGVKEEVETKAVGRRRPWGWRWRGNRGGHQWRKMEAEEEKWNIRRRNARSAQDMKSKMWNWRWRRRQKRSAENGGSENNSWTQPMTEEEEPKKETAPPQFLQFALLGGDGGLLPEGLLTGTHMQLNWTVDGSHFTPSILSGSTLAINGQPGPLPQDGSVLQVSTGLTYVPPPPHSLHPLLLEPKEEMEAVEIGTQEVKEAAGQAEEEEEEEEQLCSNGVTDTGMYYDIEVDVPDSESDETLTAPSTPPEVTDDVTGDVTTSDVAYKPPEFISLNSGSFSLLGGGVTDEVTCGRDLLELLQELKRTVLPAHWVPVLADGPLLQLLQCSRLSTMANTIVHIQPDRCFYITVQSRLLPDTHTLYHTHPARITRLGQLVSLLLDLEQLIVCRGSRVRSPSRRLEARSPTCHLLVAPPCVTCVPCLVGEEEEEEEEEEEQQEEEEEYGDEVSEDELSVSLIRTSDL